MSCVNATLMDLHGCLFLCWVRRETVAFVCAHCTILLSELLFEKEAFGKCQQYLSVMLWRWSSMCRCCRFMVSWRCNWMLQEIFSICSPNNALCCYPNVKLSVRNLSLNTSTAPVFLQFNYGLEFGRSFTSLHICWTNWQDKQNYTCKGSNQFYEIVS